MSAPEGREVVAASAPSFDLVLTTTAAVIDRLGDLVETGFFGETVEQCAEQLLRERLREVRK